MRLDPELDAAGLRRRRGARRARCSARSATTRRRPATRRFAALHGLFWLALNLAGPPAAGALRRRPALGRPAVAALPGLPRAAPRRRADPDRRDAAQRRARRRPRGSSASSSHDPAEASVRPGAAQRRGRRRAARRARSAASADPAFADACHRATGGNPLLLRQLVRALEAEGVPPDAAHAETVRQIGPRAVSRTLLLRLARLDAAAIARRPRRRRPRRERRAAAPSCALTGLDERTVAEAPAALAGRRDPAAGRRRSASCTRSCATRCTTSCRPRERELDHARAAARAGRARRARRRRRRAAPAGARAAATRPSSSSGSAGGARRPAAAGAAESAVAYLQRALDEPVAPDARPRLLLRARAGRGADQRPGGPRAPVRGLRRARPTRCERALAAGVLARAVLFTQRRPPRPARSPCAARASCPTRWPTSAASCEAMADVTLIFGLDRGELADAPPLAGRAGRGACAAPARACWPGSRRGTWTQQGGPADDVRRARAAGAGRRRAARRDNGLLSIAAARHADVLNDRDEALAAWDDALADAHRHGSLFSIMARAPVARHTLLQRGDLRGGRGELRQARDGLRRLGQRRRHALLQRRSWRGPCVARGDLAGARGGARARARRAATTPTAAASGCSRELRAALAEGRHDEALARAGAAIERFQAIPNPALAPWRSRCRRGAGAARPAGRGRAAGRGGARRRPRASARRRRSPARCACSGTLRGDDGLAALQEAVDVAAALARPLRARPAALAALGEALRRARRPADAREPLRRALELADACGAAAPARARARRAARHRRAAAHQRAAGVEPLTASERRVAGAGGRRRHQPRHRPGALRHAEDRRGAPLQRLPQARRPLPPRARRRPRLSPRGRPVRHHARMLRPLAAVLALVAVLASAAPAGAATTRCDDPPARRPAAERRGRRAPRRPRALGAAPRERAGEPAHADGRRAPQLPGPQHHDLQGAGDRPLPRHDGRDHPVGRLEARRRRRRAPRGGRAGVVVAHEHGRRQRRLLRPLPDPPPLPLLPGPAPATRRPSTPTTTAPSSAPSTTAGRPG